VSVGCAKSTCYRTPGTLVAHRMFGDNLSQDNDLFGFQSQSSVSKRVSQVFNLNANTCRWPSVSAPTGRPKILPYLR